MTKKGVFPHVPSSPSPPAAVSFQPQEPRPSHALPHPRLLISRASPPPAPPSKARAYLSSKEHLSCSAIKSPAPHHDHIMPSAHITLARPSARVLSSTPAPPFFKELNSSCLFHPSPRSIRTAHPARKRSPSSWSQTKCSKIKANFKYRKTRF